MRHLCTPWAMLTLAIHASVVHAQLPPGAAQQIYEREIANCNQSGLPDPMRRACVRAAGERLDRALGGTPPDTAVNSPDGRATVVLPEGATLPPTSSEPVPSPDGRSSVVPAR